MKKVFIPLILLLSLRLFSQSIAGLYVNDFKNIIGDTSAETELLNYAQSNGFNYLILYNLTYIHNNIFALDDVTTSLPLANFINTAKTSYGILEVGGVGEKNSSFDKMKVYNSFYPSTPNKKIDVFNVEFEFWNNSLVDPGEYYCTTYLIPNGLPCTIAGAFDYYNSQLALLKTYCDANGITAETYIGYPSYSQSGDIVLNTHRVLVHYYRTSDVYGSGDSIYQYNEYRVEDLAQNPVTIMPIFSARPAHMFSWLTTPHPLTQPYNTFINGTNGYNDQSGDWKDNVTFDGYVWYRYTDLLEIEEVLLVESNAIENQYVFADLELNTLHFSNFGPNNKGIIYAINGQEIMRFDVNEIIHLPQLSQGIYIVKVETKNGLYSQKILL